MKGFFVVITAVFLFLGVVAWVGYAYPHVPYITVDALGLEFSQREYHQRVRGQIERDGFEYICIQHLGTLTHVAKLLSVNSARQNLVYVTECAEAQE